MSNRNDPKGVAVAMSGGVDSAVSAFLLKEAGYRVVGITFKLFDNEIDCIDSPLDAESLKKVLKAKSRSCCDESSAGMTAEKLGIEHHIIDLSEEFSEYIVKPFVNGYASGRTPNPCVYCNEVVKWRSLIAIANELCLEKIATGHFAKICDSLICRALDRRKDQSYFLYRLTKSQIARTIFPLENFHKTDVRNIAIDAGLPSADRLESHEVCFYPKGGLRDFLENKGLKSDPGIIRNIDGTVLGEHSGWFHFTIGQRHGLGIASSEGRLYVAKIDPTKNEIILGNLKSVMNSRFTIVSAIFHILWDIGETKSAIVQIRHFGEKVIGEITRKGDDIAIVRLLNPVFAPTPGQSAVFFVDDCIVGGGIIDKVIE